MPWSPGFRPVANVAQATGDSGGLVVRQSLSVPRRARDATVGSSPMSSFRMSGSTPSKPSTNTRRPAWANE